MRDAYGRITPDFEAWRKLGYELEETHGQTYTLCDDPDSYFDFVSVVCKYGGDGEPEYSKERFTFPDSESEEFTPEEKAQIERDVANWRAEVGRRAEA